MASSTQHRHPHSIVHTSLWRASCSTGVSMHQETPQYWIWYDLLHSVWILDLARPGTKLGGGWNDPPPEEELEPMSPHIVRRSEVFPRTRSLTDPPDSGASPSFRVDGTGAYFLGRLSWEHVAIQDYPFLESAPYFLAECSTTFPFIPLTSCAFAHLTYITSCIYSVGQSTESSYVVVDALSTVTEHRWQVATLLSSYHQIR
jgi:hypothetical protein